MSSPCHLGGSSGARVSSERGRTAGRTKTATATATERGVRRWATEGGRRGRETSGEGSDVPIREAQAMLLRPLLQFTLKRDNARCDHSELQAPTPPSLHCAHQLSVGEHFPLARTHHPVLVVFAQLCHSTRSSSSALHEIKRRRNGGRGRRTTWCLPPSLNGRRGLV